MDYVTECEFFDFHPFLDTGGFIQHGCLRLADSVKLYKNGLYLRERTWQAILKLHSADDFYKYGCTGLIEYVICLKPEPEKPMLLKNAAQTETVKPAGTKAD